MQNGAVYGQNIKERTKRAAIDVIKLVENLPRRQISDVVGKQIMRSVTSIGANYRSVCRARSKAEFISKLGVVLEEADETLYWLEIALETNIVTENQTQKLTKELNELIAIFVTSIKTAKENQ